MFTLMIILKKRYDIDIINFEKIKNYLRAQKIRKKLSKGEKYLEKIPIQTFDGSGSTTHPYIIELEKPLNAYRYYFVHTPYDNHNVELENPSLSVSNDGINFIKPKDVKDPLLPIIKEQTKELLKYYSDNFILSDNGELQIWYRYTEEDKSTKKPRLKNQIYRIISKDGINFSDPELIIDDDGIWYLSPSIVKIENLYYLYYFDKDHKFYVKTSQNLKKWNKATEVKITDFDNPCWHGEVKLIENQLYLLLLTRNYELYLCQSDSNSPFKFNKSSRLRLNYYDKRYIYGHAHPYKGSFLIKDGYITLYIPYVVNTLNYFKIHGLKRTKWSMTYTRLKLNDLIQIN